MGRFDRYVLARLLAVFGFFALVLILIYWINRAVILFDRLIADGQPGLVFLEFTALYLPQIIRIVLPIAAFAAAVYVTNRMSADSELTVAQATGASPWRLARPVIVFGLIVSAMLAVLTHVLAPAAQGRLALREAEIAQTTTARLLQDGEFLTPVEGVTLFIRNITQGGELQDLFLSDMRDADLSLIYTASAAYLVPGDTGPQLVLRDGLAQRLDTDTGRLSTTAFDDLAYDIGALVELPDAAERTSRQLPTWDLMAPTEALMEEVGKDRARLFAEAQERLAEPILALGAALLGFATLVAGGFSRFGIWRQIVGAIFLVILVKGVETVTTAAVRDDPALWPAVWLPGLAAFALSAGLLALTGRRRRVQAGMA